MITDYEVTVVAGGLELDIRRLGKGFYFVTLIEPASGVLKSGKLVKVKD